MGFAHRNEYIYLNNVLQSAYKPAAPVPVNIYTFRKVKHHKEDEQWRYFSAATFEDKNIDHAMVHGTILTTPENSTDIRSRNDMIMKQSTLLVNIPKTDSVNTKMNRLRMKMHSLLGNTLLFKTTHWWGIYSVGNQRILFCRDTGSFSSYLNEETAEKLGLPPVKMDEHYRVKLSGKSSTFLRSKDCTNRHVHNINLMGNETCDQEETLEVFYKNDGLAKRSMFNGVIFWMIKYHMCISVLFMTSVASTVFYGTHSSQMMKVSPAMAVGDTIDLKINGKRVTVTAINHDKDNDAFIVTMKECNQN
eukprot:968829_1